MAMIHINGPNMLGGPPFAPITTSPMASGYGSGYMGYPLAPYRGMGMSEMGWGAPMGGPMGGYGGYMCPYMDLAGVDDMMDCDFDQLEMLYRMGRISPDHYMMMLHQGRSRRRGGMYRGFGGRSPYMSMFGAGIRAGSFGMGGAFARFRPPLRRSRSYEYLGWF